MADKRLRVLHIAPEPGIERRLRALPNLDYVTTDLMDPTVMVKADLTSLPFRTGQFDLLLCSHVLEHIPDDRAAMAEIARVLASDGRAVMQHPIDRSRDVTLEDITITSPEQRQHAYYQRDHVRLYGNDFGDRLRRAGLDFEAISYNEILSHAERDRYRTEQQTPDTGKLPFQGDRIYVCRRGADPRAAG